MNKNGKIALGLAIGTGLVLLISKKVGAEEGGGEDKFSMPLALGVVESGPQNGYSVTFSITIKNKGSAAGTHQLSWGSNESGVYQEEGLRIITLQPGESYEWAQTYSGIESYYRGYLTCWLYGDWKSTPSEGVWQ